MWFLRLAEASVRFGWEPYISTQTSWIDAESIYEQDPRVPDRFHYL